MVRIPTNRTPTHPGEMLLEEFLKPMGITQKQLSVAVHVPFNELMNLSTGREVLLRVLRFDFQYFLEIQPNFG